MQDDLKSKTELLKELSGAHPQISELENQDIPFSQTLLDAVPAHIAVLDESGKIILVNSSWKQFADENNLDNSNNYCIGENYFSFEESEMENVELDYTIQAIKDILSGKSTSFETEYPCHSPIKKRWFRMHATAFEFNNVNNNKSTRKGVLISHIDISYQKSIENSLRQSRDLLDATEHVSRVGGWEWDVFSRTMFWTDETYRIHDIEKDEIEEGSINHIERSIKCYDKADRDTVLNAFHDCIVKGKSYDLELPFTTFKGKRLYIRTSARALLENGKTVRVTGNIIDVTERKKSQEALQNSENNLRKFFNTINDYVFILDRNFKIIQVNNTVLERLGYDKNELIGLSVLKLHPENLKKEVRSNLTEMFAGNRRTCTIPLISKSGKSIPVETGAAKGIWDDQEAIFAICKDISDLTVSEEKFKQAFHNNPSIAGLSDLETGKYVEVNKTFYQKLGFTPEEVIGTQASGLVKLDLKFRDRAIEKLKKFNHIENEEAVIYTKSGKPINVLLSAEIIILNGIKYNYTSAVDITDRKKAELALIASERKFKQLSEVSPSGIWQTDMQGRLTYVSRRWSEITGLTLKKALGSGWTKTIHPDDIDDLLKNWQNCDAQIKSFQSEFRYLQGEGNIVWVLCTANLIKDEITSVKKWVCTLTDITKRKKAEEELKVLSKVIEQSHLLIMLTDADGIIEYVNLKFCDFTGYSLDEVRGKKSNLLDCSTSSTALYDKIWETIRNGKTWDGELQNKKKNGECYWEQTTISPLFNRKGKITHFVNIKEDITEHKKIAEEKSKLEEQLRRSQKLETIGTLAGGIAHDFNNILTPILGYTDMALIETGDENSRLFNDLKIVKQAAHRAKDLIENILLFSKQVEKEKSPLHLHLIVKEALKLLRSSIPVTINIENDIASDCDRILADATQMHQVIVNICTNAWQAMEKSGGTLRISMKQEPVDNETRAHFPKLNHDDEYIHLTFEDTGCGMPPAVLDRIFEPFFTTKPVDKGTGLGLSVVHGIVQNHGGEIKALSKEGEGSIFHILLPVIKDKQEALNERQEEIAHGNEHILIIDDDPIIAGLVKTMVEQFGYSAESFFNSVDALETLKQKAMDYDLVISDLTMPNMTGLELAAAVKAERQDLPFIIMSGYSSRLDPEKNENIRAVVLKPIEMKELSQAIKTALNKQKN